jgi:CubicO group peptidase (beta-lactamase class C family)
MKRLTLSLICVVVIATGTSASQTRPARVFPGAAWERVSDPRAAGYCPAGLDAVGTKVKGLTTTAMTVVVGGRVLYDYGPQDEVSYLASVRKSILAMMFGSLVERGAVKLDATMADLGIDDVGGLLPLEKTATVAQLLSARSGVYHEAANAACTGCGSTAGDPPGPRGTVKPGTYFLYNNWDFNALGTIFEKAAGKSIYAAFEEDYARPMQFEDFKLDAQRKTSRPRASEHPAYHFYLSTRDMARIGYLMLRNGDWNGRQLLSSQWAAKITTTVTPVNQMNPEEMRKGPFGYGYLWWMWDGEWNKGIFKGAYTGIGAVGQFITVLPALDMVVAHKTRANAPQPVTRPQYLGILESLAAARGCGASQYEGATASAPEPDQRSPHR